MAKAQNTFLGSKMNKDIDARLLQNGDYRNALNVQISRSEGDGVGSLENVLGNSLAVDFEALTGIADLTCIGYFSDDINNVIYLFLTDYTDPSPSNFLYSPTANNFIYAYNTVTKNATKLVEGNFLNFSKTNYIYGVNVLEDFLFWTDNRNQPRKINTVSALSSSSYYQTEDQISVSTYNPYQSILLYRQSLLATGTEAEYETTMLDVTSKFYPNGGLAEATAGTYVAGASITITNIQGNIYIGAELKTSTGITTIPASTTVTDIENANPPTFIKLSNGVTIDALDNEIIFEPNPYFESSYNGDPNYLEDKFVRFGYRFNYVDGENSIFSPFTQPAFIPKQDGYFISDKTLFVNTPADTVGEVYASREKDDQKLSYQSTIVEFMENKVNKILLYVPLPFNNYDLQNALKVDSIDILYKESNQTAVKVIEQVSIETIFNSAGIAEVTAGATSNSFAIENIQGGILVGSQVTYAGSSGSAITVTAFTPTNPAIPTSGTITLSDTITLGTGDIITIGNPRFYIYDYQSRKPFKVLPEADLIRVYDKTPVRSLAQEIISNRVVYGNFQNKHTPPAFLDYNVNAGEKVSFLLNTGTASALANPGPKDEVVLSVGTEVGSVWASSGTIVGSVITSTSPSSSIPPGTIVQAYDAVTGILTLTNLTNIGAGDIIELTPASDIQDATSIIEYPNHSLKQNRNYQVGFVLSDRYGRQSSVVLSNSLSTVQVRGIEFKGSTIYSAYNSNAVVQSRWPGDSLKISLNTPIGPVNKNTGTGWPGLYNSDPSSSSYNPLGWYSFKIVVKQTEQEYYNVYLPGIMAAYPNDLAKELGKTSHAVLINDNINKIPRDLSEVGPQQKQFRSSVEVFGRVENDVNVTVAEPNLSKNVAYYPGIKPDTVSIISTLNDLFDFSPLVSERPDFFPQFYAYTSDPLIARISTENKIGEIADTEFVTASGIVDITLTPPPTGAGATNEMVTLADVKNGGAIVNGMLVRGGGLAEGTTVVGFSDPVLELSATIGSGAGSGGGTGTASNTNIFSQGDVLTIFKDPEVDPPGIQYLAVYETTPVDSLLDIFWETSSSGLISELNTAVLSENTGGFVLQGFNDDLFKEDLAVGSDIINSTPAAPGFTVQDVFGNDIPAANFTVEFASIDGVSDAITDLENGNRTADFILEQSSTAGFYQIKTNSLFVYTDNPAPRNIIFNIKVTNTVTGAVSFFVETAELQNDNPEFLVCLNSPGYSGPDGLVVPDIVINQTDTIVVNKIEGKNGSRFFDDGTTGAGGTKFNAGEGLNFEIFAAYRASALATYPGGFVTEAEVLAGVTNEDSIIPGLPLDVNSVANNPFELNTTIATSNSINGGVSFATLTKPSQTQPIFRSGPPSDDVARGYLDWIVWLKLTDANGSIGSETTTPDPYCRLVIRINYSLIPSSFRQLFITPRDLNIPVVGASSPDTYIDATAEVDSVVGVNSFKIINLSGDNIYYSTLHGNFGLNPPAAGPIWNAFSFTGGPDGNVPYSPTAEQIPEFGSTDWINNWFPPNALILNSLEVSTGVIVKSVAYTNTGATGLGTEATIETFTPHGLTGGNQIKFTSGRLLVTAPNNAGATFTQPLFPRIPVAGAFPNPGVLSQADLCAQITNASPAKKQDGTFYQQPIEVFDTIPMNPFIGDDPNFVVSGWAGMIVPGTETAGTINAEIPENCSEG
jgi:hypothetical protein